MIAWGMWTQALGIWVIVAAPRLASGSARFGLWAAGAVLLGAGTALVYPTLPAAVGDIAEPVWRASAVGVYRLWRDLGYAAGALLSGIVADLYGLSSAIPIIGGLTFLSGIVVALRMGEVSALGDTTSVLGTARQTGPVRD